MAIFNESDIRKRFDDNLKEAKNLLKKLEVFCGNEPKFTGLDGWVFEKTVQYCIRKEFNAKGIEPDIEEQFILVGRAKIDLRVGDVLIEIKTSGCWGCEGKKYRDYFEKAREKKLRYAFLSLDEREISYHNELIEKLEKQNAFYLFLKGECQEGEWKRFIDVLTDKRH